MTDPIAIATKLSPDADADADADDKSGNVEETKVSQEESKVAANQRLKDHR